MKTSLRTKLILVISIAIILTTLVVSLVTINKFTANTEEIVYSKVDDLVLATGNQIEMKVGELKTIVDMLTGAPELQNFLVGETVSEEIAYKYMQNMYEKNSDIMESLILITAGKKGVMTESETDLALDLSSRKYLDEAAKGYVVVSEPIESKATGNMIIAVAAPVMNGDKLVGYLVASIPFSEIQEIVNSVNVFEKGYSYMFNSEGVVIAYPDKDQLFELNLTKQNVPVLNEMITNVNNKMAGKDFYTFKGEYKYVNYMPVENWGVAVTANYSDYMSTTVSTTVSVIIVAVIMTLLAIVLMFVLISIGLIKPIRHIEKAMNVAGDGDLTVLTQVKAKDEIGSISQSFNNMVTSQKGVVESISKSTVTLEQVTAEISQSSLQVSESSSMIAVNCTELASVAIEQNESVTEASQVILQLASLIELAKERAKTASNNIKDSLEAAEIGRENVGTTIEAINNIKTSSVTTNESLIQVANLSEKIGGVVETINSIASQTNLLALNASIEAARAGEHGRGFSVVAEEVRNLSEQTATEANEISAVISSMTAQINDVVESMKLNSKSVETGVIRAGDTDLTFVHILETFEKVMEDILKIEAITDDEVVSSDEVIGIINNIGELSDMNNASAQDIAAAVEEQTALLENISASSQEINVMAEELGEVVGTFKLD